MSVPRRIAAFHDLDRAGVMGKGLALQFKQAFPANFRAYKHSYSAGEVRRGHMLTVPTRAGEPGGDA